MTQSSGLDFRGACGGLDSFLTRRAARIRSRGDAHPLWEVNSAQKTRLLRGKGTNLVSG